MPSIVPVPTPRSMPTAVMSMPAGGLGSSSAAELPHGGQRFVLHGSLVPSRAIQPGMSGDGDKKASSPPGEASTPRMVPSMRCAE